MSSSNACTITDPATLATVRDLCTNAVVPCFHLVGETTWTEQKCESLVCALLKANITTPKALASVQACMLPREGTAMKPWTVGTCQQADQQCGTNLRNI